MATTNSTYRSSVQLEKALRTYTKDLRSYEARIKEATTECHTRFKESYNDDDAADLRTTELLYSWGPAAVDDEDTHHLYILFGDGNSRTLHDVYTRIVDLLDMSSMKEGHQSCVRFALLTALDLTYFCSSDDIESETNVEFIIGTLLNELRLYITDGKKVRGATLRACKSVNIKASTAGNEITLTLSLPQPSDVVDSLPLPCEKLINDTADRLESCRLSLLSSIDTITGMAIYDETVLTYVIQGLESSIKRFITAFDTFDAASWEDASDIDDGVIEWETLELAALFNDPEG